MKALSIIQASCGSFKTYNHIGGLNVCEAKFNITMIKLLQKSSNLQLLLSLCPSRYPGTKTTHGKSNQKETTSMKIICTGDNIFLQLRKKL